MKDSVIEKIYEANDVNVPDVMVDDEVDAMVRESEQQLSMSGLQLEQYLKMVGQDMAGFRKDIREEAFRRVKSRMLISAVVEAEDIQATEEQINEQIDLMAIQYQMEADKVREMLGEQNMRYLESDVKMRNAIQFLYDNAVITEPAEEAEEKSEEAAE